MKGGGPCGSKEQLDRGGTAGGEEQMKIPRQEHGLPKVSPCAGESWGQGSAILPAPPSTNPRWPHPAPHKGRHNIKSTKTEKKAKTEEGPVFSHITPLPGPQFPFVNAGSWLFSYLGDFHRRLALEQER